MDNWHTLGGILFFLPPYVHGYIDIHNIYTACGQHVDRMYPILADVGGLTSQPIAKGYVHMCIVVCIVFAVVSSLSTCYSQLIHMPGYGELRGHRGANGL